jgi:hypothetical protein
MLPTCLVALNLNFKSPAAGLYGFGNTVMSRVNGPEPGVGVTLGVRVSVIVYVLEGDTEAVALALGFGVSGIVGVCVAVGVVVEPGTRDPVLVTVRVGDKG